MTNKIPAAEIYSDYQISKELNMHFNTISKYINEMDNLGLLEKKKVNNIEFISLDIMNSKVLKPIL